MNDHLTPQPTVEPTEADIEAAKPQSPNQFEVTHVMPHGRAASGQLYSGVATFSDGKEWHFGRSNNDDRIWFTVDTGMPSSWSTGNWHRSIAPPKRVAALNEYFAAHCNYCFAETEPDEAACIHCGKSKVWAND